MGNIIFISTIGIVFSIIYIAAFRTLPEEKWQVFAAVPVKKNYDGTWRGVNITWYGLISSTGNTIASALFILMMFSAGASGIEIVILTACMLLLFVPSAKIVAYVVEGKRYTLTVGGGVFIMIAGAPWIIAGLKYLPVITFSVRESVFLSAMVTAYAFGEGFGRLACISFGCCYGRALNELPPFARRIFKNLNFV